jgi:hypothetical protein
MRRVMIARSLATDDALIMRTTQDLVSRIRAEYLEMPGMRLTIQQVQRLCGIEQTLCKAVLDSLVGAKFLCVKSDGAYARLTDGEVSRFRER